MINHKANQSALNQLLTPLEQEFLITEHVGINPDGRVAFDCKSNVEFDFVVKNLGSLVPKVEKVIGKEIRGGGVVHCKSPSASCQSNCQKKFGCRVQLFGSRD